MLHGHTVNNKTNDREKNIMNNPYQPPRANVGEVDASDYQEVQMWSTQGRIGRLRFLAYFFGSYWLFSLLLGFTIAIVGPGIGTVMVGLVGIGLAVFAVFTAVKRCHDMDLNGWMAVLMFIPIVNFFWMLVLVIAPGTKGLNDYGAPPEPNTTGVKVVAALFPTIMVIGILAAIALPAYQKYVERSHASEQQR